MCICPCVFINRHMITHDVYRHMHTCSQGTAHRHACAHTCLFLPALCWTTGLGNWEWVSRAGGGRKGWGRGWEVRS